MFNKFRQKLKDLFSSRRIDDAFFDDLEDTLIEGDLGARLTDEVIETLRREAKAERATSVEDLQRIMKGLLSPYVKTADVDLAPGGLNVFLILGVNGVGKTTSIAKMASWYTRHGNRVLLAAADTFRAAAVDQLDIHAKRLGMRIVKQSTGSDPGAVVYDALSSALAQGDDLILADTAGRMHNKENLMKELQKIDKIISNRGIPQERYRKYLVIDATTGQNGAGDALQQRGEARWSDPHEIRFGCKGRGPGPDRTAAWAPYSLRRNRGRL